MGKQNIAEMEIDLYARDMRMVRAAGDVTKKYSISRSNNAESNKVWFEIKGGTKPYVVGIHPEWKDRPNCSCPDAAQRALTQNGGFCKHIIAVLLKEQDFKCQLLELFL